MPLTHLPSDMTLAFPLQMSEMITTETSDLLG
jgi:hypothetical protein